MSKIKPLIIIILSAGFLFGCGDCEKLNLSDDEKAWVNHFHVGQSYLFKNSNGLIDTLQVIDSSNKYSSCNRFELSEFQYEFYLASLKLKSKNHYRGSEVMINISTEEWKKRIPYIYFGNLGPHRNDLENSLPVAIDTILNGQRFDSVYYYAKDLNTEQYGESEYFKNFFWQKKLGLVAYTTINNELFILINQ